MQNLSLAWVTRFTAGFGPTGNIPAPAGRGAPAPYPVIVGGLGTGDFNAGGSPRLGGGILMVNGILYMSAPTMPGPSTRVMARSFGNITGKRAAARTPETAAWACGTTTYTWKFTTTI